MRRLVLALIVAILTFSASGVSAVLLTEPCSGIELPGRDDGACPPTCVTCGCCTQAVEAVALHSTSAPLTPIADIQPSAPRLPNARAFDILHVPKFHSA